MYLGRGHALEDGPGLGLGGARGEVRLQAQRVVRCSHQRLRYT